MLAIFAVLIGLLALLWSAEKFISNAALLAKSLNVPALVIGMVIVGFGTSAPEMLVSAFAASEGNTQLALGNAYGSNIVNIGLVLGITALIAPIAVKSMIVKKELPILSFIVLVSLGILFDGVLSRMESVFLLLAFAALLVWTIRGSQNSHNDPFENAVIEQVPHEKTNTFKTITWLVLGLVVMLLSSRGLVWGAIEIARYFEVSELFIGLTIVALGTSLPELAASIIAIKKNEHDLAVGNIVGSNMFNLLAVVGIGGVIHPAAIDSSLIYRDWLVMTILTGILFVSAIGFKGKEGSISRMEGGILFSIYIAYTVYLIWTAV